MIAIIVSMLDLLKSSSTWELIGKIGTLVALLGPLGGAVIWVFNRVGASRSPISVSGQYFNFDVPQAVQASIRKLLDAINPSNMKQYIAGDWTDAQRMEAAMSLYNYFETMIDEYVRRRLEGFSSAWTFSIRNTGHKELASLILETPLEGVYVIKRDGSPPESSLFKQHLSLGSLRGANTITVSVWAWYGSGSIWNESDIRVTYPEGRVGVRFPRRVWLMPGWLCRCFSRRPAFLG